MLIIFAFASALMPMTMAVAMTIDCARAARAQTKLNTVADAAALAAVSKPQVSQSALDASAKTISMFYDGDHVRSPPDFLELANLFSAGRPKS